MKFRFYLLLFLTLTFLLGCHPKKTDEANDSVESTSSRPSFIEKKKAIRFLAPTGHFPDWLKEKLSQKLHQEIQVDLYNQEDEAISKSIENYNFIFVSDRSLSQLIQDKKLESLNVESYEIKEEPQFLHHYFDPNNRYSLPYGISLSGIAYRFADFKTPIRRWNDIFNSTNLSKTLFPRDLLLEQKLAVRGGAHWDQLTKEKTSAVTSLSPSEGSDNSSATTENKIEVNSIAFLRKKYGNNKEWRIILPEEGAAIYLYHIAVPAGKNGTETTQILDQIFDPEVMARFDSENFLAVPLKGISQFVSSETLKDSLIYPGQHYLDHCFFIRP